MAILISLFICLRNVDVGVLNVASFRVIIFINVFVIFRFYRLMETSEPSTDAKHLVGPREVIVLEVSDREDSSVGGSSEDEEKIPISKDKPPEYWHIQKLVKYLKSGNQTATVVSLCCLKDHDLTSQINQCAIQDIGGLEILINLLETDDLKCKLGTLSVLTELSQNMEIRRCITDLGGIPLLLKNLTIPARDLQIHVGETLYNVAQISKARKHVRKYNGIEKLVDLLDISEHLLLTPLEELNADSRLCVGVVQAAARALWSVSRSSKNIQVMMKSGIIPLIARLLHCVHMGVIIPSVGVIAQCSNDSSYQLAIQTEGMIKDIVKHLANPDEPQLRRYCAEIIFKCSEDAMTRDMVRQAGGLDPLVTMAKDVVSREDKNLLAAVTGAIWKTAISKENVERYEQMATVQVLVKLLENVDEKEEVLSNAVGALSEFVRHDHNRETLRRCNGIPLVVNLLNYTFPPLLENVPMVIRECAKEPASMRIIEQLDGVRLIWSLLKNSSHKVQAHAAWSLVPCIKYAMDSGEMVRSFVGGLELIVNLLKSKDNDVLACVCAAIAEVAKDTENLGVITDHGVVPMLVHLVTTQDTKLREHLASAIAYCCAWGSNCKMFGRLGAITHLVGYMASNDVNTHRNTAVALFYLSKNSFNCITMHECGVVPFLLRSVASEDKELQQACAGCLANIRRLALEAETYHLITRGKPPEESSSSSSEENND
ncbi:PREDICTED: armadillo repeat-containing protein 4 [Nicrophorus vespilloides]|uniref:Armadillo repeat-containing protein 4 n=1 Tax=Nicrophorus vespilloides TaxID=110193 RepID=A0ABM1N524_NICVS|nr:PREDICTED: armadillo repeat-containing protein 4 [Nicrophorus vespilloides]